MSASAIVMMLVAIAIVWGGLLTAILLLRRHPDDPRDIQPGHPHV
ncbi:methionine/alanine import family NSS transporter small subunit [Streptomyces aidingensis]|uniref:Putative methionine and alanine importer, small subunit n=1 Tax=Streptomyces aidingensis TaxID=910347 RepID=A0A1I1FTX4_9ACTN|nr:methionine/alanine import family NSS transporter small subunit [Streptomyces aidingensis]SFC00430.1 Putative methionine and alanine importer, small subunit [Streptomyces aidingensis]